MIIALLILNIIVSSVYASGGKTTTAIAASEYELTPPAATTAAVSPKTLPTNVVNQQKSFGENLADQPAEIQQIISQHLSPDLAHPSVQKLCISRLQTHIQISNAFISDDGKTILILPFHENIHIYKYINGQWVNIAAKAPQPFSPVSCLWKNIIASASTNTVMAKDRHSYTFDEKSKQWRVSGKIPSLDIQALERSADHIITMSENGKRLVILEDKFAIFGNNVTVSVYEHIGNTWLLKCSLNPFKGKVTFPQIKSVSFDGTYILCTCYSLDVNTDISKVITCSADSKYAVHNFTDRSISKAIISGDTNYIVADIRSEARFTPVAYKKQPNGTWRPVTQLGSNILVSSLDSIASNYNASTIMVFGPRRSGNTFIGYVIDWCAKDAFKDEWYVLETALIGIPTYRLTKKINSIGDIIMYSSHGGMWVISSSILFALKKLTVLQLNMLMDLDIQQTKDPHALIILNDEEVKIFKTFPKPIRDKLLQLYKITTAKTYNRRKELAEQRKNSKNVKMHAGPATGSATTAVMPPK